MTEPIDIRIECEDGKTSYRGGESIHGKVIVDASAEYECRDLSIALGWHTETPGIRDQEEVTRVSLYSGSIPARSDFEHTFELEVPCGPFTYHGEHLNIVWKLEARADMVEGDSPEAEARVDVQPGPHDGPLAYEPCSEAVTGVLDHPKQEGITLATTVTWLVLCALLIALSGVMITVVGLDHWKSWVVLVFCVACLFQSGRKLLAASKLGGVELEASPRRLSPGALATCTLRCRPRRRTRLRGISCRLLGKEFWRRQTPDGQRNGMHTFYEETSEALPDGRDIAGGAPFEISHRVATPESGPLSYDLGNSKVIWLIEVHVDIEGWPDLIRQLPLSIVPSEIQA